MPHSGGGGSHSGGGSHGGGHGGSGGSSIRVSNKPFAGCHTYAIYNKNGGVRLAYSNSSSYRAEKTKSEMIAEVMFSSFFAIPGIIEFIIIIFMVASFFHNGVRETKIPGYVDQRVKIIDEFDYVSYYEEEELKEVLEKFKRKTGIIPAVKFTNDYEWQRNYTDMESYAYNEYVVNFSDEYHLLIVYSYGYIDNVTGFNEFNWHTMWGDDLGKTAGTSDENYLADLLQKELSRANGSEVPSTIGKVFDEFYDRLDYHGFKVEVEELFIILFLLVHGGVFFIVGLMLSLGAIKAYKKSKESGEVTYKISNEPKLLNCPYCGTSFYEGTIGTCKFCGAPISYNSSTV